MGHYSSTRIRVSPFNVFFIVPVIALNRVSKTRYSWGISVLQPSIHLSWCVALEVLGWHCLSPPHTYLGVWPRKCWGGIATANHTFVLVYGSEEAINGAFMDKLAFSQPSQLRSTHDCFVRQSCHHGQALNPIIDSKVATVRSISRAPLSRPVVLKLCSLVAH